MFFQPIKDLAEKDGITKTLKAENQMLWVQRMKAVRETAAEIVNNDLHITLYNGREKSPSPVYIQ